MTLHALRGRPDAGLAAALAEFEAGFTYPLGPGRTFRIDHGEDYPLFFRAIGDATSFVVTSKGQVRGVTGVAVRPLMMPDGTVRNSAYAGDVKASAGRVLVQLATAADAWVRPRVDCAYGIVMDGTAVLPERYTGRVGIERFSRLASVFVLRLATADGPAGAVVDAARGEELFRTLSAGRIAPLGGDPAARSEMAAAWLGDEGGRACGRLEDTRRAKRLVASDGVEMRSAHLACFAFRTYDAGAAVIHAARARAAALGFPALFVAVAPHDLAGLEQALGAGVDKVVAPATIYGAGLDAVGAAAWNVSSSEI